jgi:phosphoglycolate phosphatase-like HAD superfamily hydrolase
MHTTVKRFTAIGVLALAAACAPPPSTPSTPAAPDSLPSWHEGATRSAILSFVEDVTAPGSPSFVPKSERIAVFDNDGTLWSEQPMYVQLAFTLDRVKALATDHPEWGAKEPFRSVLAGDMAGVAASGHHGLLEMLMATHGGMTADAFDAEVRTWLAGARHPKYGLPYTELTYEPMKELLVYLRAKGFKTFIVSGGGVDFLRPWTEEVYGIPPDQVIGSLIKVRYAVAEGKPELQRLREVDFIDDGPGKPVGIHRNIGFRPILAFGNSDGDFEMLEWTTAGSGARLGLLLHHDDAARETAYDRESHFGRLARGLDEAGSRGWVVVSMKDDWKTVFGGE